jgi:hypothetical protein
MNTDEKVYPSGQHYSAQNRIPNIKQFVEGLDRDKKKRDAEIDTGQNQNGGSAGDHVPAKEKSGKNRRTVRDPVTGKDVEIADIDEHHMKAADEPMVCISPFPLPPSPFPLPPPSTKPSRY